VWFLEVPGCILCLLESRYEELRSVGARDLRSYVEVGRCSIELTPRGRSAAFVGSYECLKRVLGVRDPHAKDKEGLEILAKSIVEGLGVLDDLALFELAAAANSVDISMRGYRFEKGAFANGLNEKAVWLGLGQGELLDLLARAKSVGYVVDNAGEFQVDMLLLKRLKERGLRISVYARGEPYELDVVADYVRNALEGIGAEVISSGGAHSVFSVENLREMLRKHDLLISKGLDNFETYLEFNPALNNVVFLLRAKCPVVAEKLGVSRGKPVIISSRWSTLSNLMQRSSLKYYGIL